MSEDLARVWQSIIRGHEKSWVLFENGTCVILMDPKDDLATQAVQLMKEWGPVYPGSSAGDFSIITLDDSEGWVVTCHHNDILTYVAPEEVGDDPSEVEVGLLGRSKRQEDAESLSVVYVEDNRKAN